MFRSYDKKGEIGEDFILKAHYDFFHMSFWVWIWMVGRTTYVVSNMKD